MARTDEIIKKDIVNEFCWDSRIDASRVKVTVENGVVTLSGNVPTYGEMSAARMAAWQIEGVLDVVDDLAVSYATPPPLPSDNEIKVRAENTLMWNPVIDETAIAVSVARGIVTLEGTVNAHWKRSFVENKIGDICGIFDIENKLAVVPTERISDEIIARDVIAALDRDMRVHAADVKVEVNGGVVTLSGSVPLWSARWAAGRDASRTAGVVEVSNRLKLAA